MSQQAIRSFHLPDNKVIVHTGVIHSYYGQHADHFADFNQVKFHPEYHSDLASKIDTAKNTMSDGFVVKAQAKETSDVYNAQESLEKSLKKVHYAVKSCFEENPIIIQEFRLNNMSDFTVNTDLFISYTKDVMEKVQKYREDLITAGLTEELINTVIAQLAFLDTQRREQIETIQSRPTLTKERIDSMNDLWKHLIEIRDAADIVFDDKPEVQALFALPQPRSRRADDDRIEFGEVIGDQE